MPGIPKAVFAERDPELVRELYQLATAQIERFCPKAAEVLEEAEADALSYLDFPHEHHVRLRTNNVRERADRELRHRSRVVQVLPGRRSPIGMMGAVFSAMAGDWADRRRFDGGTIGGPPRAPRSTSPRTPTRAPRPSTRPGSSRPWWPTTRSPAGMRRSTRQSDGVQGDSRLLVQPAATLENRALNQLSGRYPRRTDPLVLFCPHTALPLWQDKSAVPPVKPQAR